MNRSNLVKLSMTAILIFMFLTSCSASSEPSAIIEVLFDGNGCTVTGPSELPPGEHTIDFIDQSEWKGELYVIYLHEGKTFQDLLDLQVEPGVWVPKPAWVDYNSVVSRESKEKGDTRIDTETYRLNRVGEHVIFCYVDDPRQLWNGAPLMIVENPSE